MRKIILFAGLIWAFGTATTLQATAATPCAGDQNQMNQCAEDNYKLAEQKLQKYQAALVKGLTGQKDKIEAAQKDWQNYAQKYCELTASDFEGGSGWPALYFACLEKRTQARLDDLKTLLAHFEMALPQ